ncbi:MAG: type II secretion system F family protein, partial [Henriciella sp.]|nr:type II secretion system F family protein [Henriciella sp.]
YFSNDVEITSKALEITQLDLVVSLLPGYAETTATVTFYNPTDAQLEGEFLLDLPTGSMIIGYGLGIEGEMIDGVLVEKKKAKKAFESRVRQGIDPGLAEITRENAFKNRVFPILPQDTRTIKVTFLSPISAAQPYRLPLNSDTPIKDLLISVAAEGLNTRPAVSLPGQMRFNWDSDGPDGTATGQNIKPQGALTITPQGEAGFALERHTTGERFLSVTMDAPENSEGKDPKTIRVYWDTSLSSIDAKTQQQVLFEALRTFDKVKIDLIPFAGAPRGEASMSKVDADAAISAISELNYNGATNLEALYASEAGRRRADICLLVTDGRATLGNAPLETLPCKTFTLSGAEDADRGVLQMLAQRSGGQFIDTRAINAAQLQQILTSDTPFLKSLKIDGRDHKDKAVWSSDGDQLRMLVPVPEGGGEVEIDFGTVSKAGQLSAMPVYTGKRLGAAWANQWIVQASASGADRDELVALSQTYSVASEVTSFLVLENVQDYVTSRVALPMTGFTKAQRAEYAELIANAEAEDRNARETRLASVIEAWKGQIEWYEASYKWMPGDNEQKQAVDGVSAAEAVAPPPIARNASRPSEDAAPSALRMHAETAPATLARAFTSMQEPIAHGDALSAAMAREPLCFEPAHVQRVRAAERIGRTGEALREIAALWERRMAMRKRLLRKAAYPL